MHIAELSQISGYTETQTRAILSAAGYQLKGQEVFGLANLDGKDITADEYLRAAKKAGVDAAQMPPAPIQDSAALAPAKGGKVAKGGRGKKKDQLTSAGENVQNSTQHLQEETVKAGVQSGIQLGHLFAGSQQVGFLNTVASHNGQLAAVLNGQISAINMDGEDAIDIEAIYEAAAMGKSASPTVGLQIFDN